MGECGQTMRGRETGMSNLPRVSVESPFSAPSGLRERPNHNTWAGRIENMIAPRMYRDRWGSTKGRCGCGNAPSEQQGPQFQAKFPTRLVASQVICRGVRGSVCVWEAHREYIPCVWRAAPQMRAT